jgi:uncharacterized protein YlxP (DUF503 family)
MVIGVLEVELSVPGSTSLKMKRGVIRSLKDRVRNEYNVSISEISNLSSVRSCTLGIAHISNDKQFSNRVLSKVVDFIESHRGAELIDYQLTFL